jgi:hypothetical protein
MLDALSLLMEGLANLAKGPRSPRERVGWARGAWYPARGAWYPARGAWYPARGAWFLARGAWYPARGAWYLARAWLSQAAVF